MTGVCVYRQDDDGKRPVDFLPSEGLKWSAVQMEMGTCRNGLLAAFNFVYFFDIPRLLWLVFW